MKRLLLTLSVLFLCNQFVLHAQQQQYEMKCQMTYEEVLRDNQPFDIDDVIAEKARDIAIALIEDFKIIYDLLNDGQTEDVDDRITAIRESIEEAESINMNYEMFKDDLEFIETLE